MQFFKRLVEEAELIFELFQSQVRSDQTVSSAHFSHCYADFSVLVESHSFLIDSQNVQRTANGPIRGRFSLNDQLQRMEAAPLALQAQLLHHYGLQRFPRKAGLAICFLGQSLYTWKRNISYFDETT